MFCTFYGTGDCVLLDTGPARKSQGASY